MTINHQLSPINYQVTSLEKGLREFAQFAAKLKGDEKSEAQTFLFHLRAAFGIQFICEFDIQKIDGHWEVRLPPQ